MATPVTSVPDYCTLLQKSRLLPPEEVESQYRQWKEEKQGTDDRVDSFRRFLIARKCLTEYQAALVQRGRPDGFFLGSYKILDRIGKGQMGGVYKAVHTSGQIVALKILPASRAKDAHTLGRFQREARLLTQLDHPNVVNAFQVGESGSVHFIAMEYLEGETLHEVLERRTKILWTEAVRLVRQTLDGLQHLHERHMVHRDLKPANIMLTPEPAKGKGDTTWEATVKLLDIGLGRELFGDDVPEGKIETQLTEEGAVLGTPDYLAPEQAKDARSSDIRADIYSVGCVLYRCIAGQTPFPDPSVMAQMLKHATEAPPPISTFAANIPPSFQKILDRFLAKSTDERFQTPAEAAIALKPFAGGGGAPVVGLKLVPAYKDWLESESQMDVPKELSQPTATKSVAPSGSAQPPLPRSVPPKPAPSKPGTATSVPLPTKPVASPPRPVAAPVRAPMPVEEEMDVELVTLPSPAPMQSYAPVAPSPERPLSQLDRRDWIMLSAGAVGVLTAVGMGYGLARALRRKPGANEEEVKE